MPGGSPHLSKLHAVATTRQCRWPVSVAMLWPCICPGLRCIPLYPHADPCSQVRLNRVSWLSTDSVCVCLVLTSAEITKEWLYNCVRGSSKISKMRAADPGYHRETLQEPHNRRLWCSITQAERS
jgi:hypothetical protein